MIDSIQKLGQVLLIAFAVIALTLGYWGFIAREDLLAREQNPRLILEEQRIRRGLILDRDGVVLAATLIDEDTRISTRHYPYPQAAPVVGYYSIRQGVGGIEAQFDDLLRGESEMTPIEQIAQQALHRPQIGGDVRLTLDYEIQREAADLLADHRGAIVVVSAPQGEVLAMASQPSFDPNQLEEAWDTLFDDPSAPLLNRATQGLYQPGTILQSIVLGSALDSSISVPREAWGDQLAMPVDGSILPCANASPQVDSIVGAYFWACPGPFRVLATAIGARRLDAALSSFGLLEAPVFALPTEPSNPVTAPAQQDLQLTAIGQSALTVTPLQMAQVAAAFANHGEIPALQLVQAVRPPGEDWRPVRTQGNPRGTISRASADAVAQLMGQTVVNGAAYAAELPDHRVYGHTGLAVAGPSGTLNAWFIGFAYRENSQAVAVAVLLEGENDVSVAAQIGGEALKSALDNLP